MVESEKRKDGMSQLPRKSALYIQGALDENRILVILSTGAVLMKGEYADAGQHD